MQLYRGRLIDHIQLVVRDLKASRRFYGALFEVLGIPIGGEAEDYFWADELFVSSADSRAALGMLTGRHHLAFQAKDRAMVDAFYKAGLAAGGKDNGGAGRAPLPPRLLRRLPARPRRQQHRGSVPRRGEAERRCGGNQFLGKGVVPAGALQPQAHPLAVLGAFDAQLGQNVRRG